MGATVALMTPIIWDKHPSSGTLVAFFSYHSLKTLALSGFGITTETK
jgi:hypothetical protein